MKRSLPALLIVCLLLTLTGCNGPQARRQSFAQLNDTYITTVDSLITAYAHGEIDRETYVDDILPVINAGDAVLDGLDAATKAGLDDATYLDQLGIIVTRLTFYAATYAPQTE